VLSETGVRAAPVPGRLAAVSLNGRTVASGGVETFPFRLPLSIGSRVALVRAGIRLRLAVRRYAAIAEPIPGEDPGERQLRLLQFMDDRSFTDFSGVLPEDVDLLFRSTPTRSSGEPEELAAGYGIGYFHLVWNRSAGLSRNILGGSGELIDAVSEGLGDRVRLGARVTAVRPDADGVRVTWTQDGVEHEARAAAAIVTTPAYVTRAIVEDLPPNTAAALDASPYGPYVVGAFLTNERTTMPWDGLYALATPKRSFSMLFNTANVLRTAEGPRQPAGASWCTRRPGSPGG
jgi:oxygen-dependent protoporphyrinogen oxidase